MPKKKEVVAGAVGDGLVPTVTQGTQAVTTDARADFSFAVNAVKLNRSIAYVNQAQAAANLPALKGKDLSDAVQARYIQIGGLLIKDKPVTAGGKGRGHVVNMAADDGSPE